MPATEFRVAMMLGNLLKGSCSASQGGRQLPPLWTVWVLLYPDDNVLSSVVPGGYGTEELSSSGSSCAPFRGRAHQSASHRINRHVLRCLHSRASVWVSRYYGWLIILNKYIW